jgi:hypothetical protein
VALEGKPFQVGPFFVKRVPSSAVRYHARHKHYWRGYICPGRGTKLISELGKLIEVTSAQQLTCEVEAYRAELGPLMAVHFAYYEIIDASAEG